MTQFDFNSRLQLNRRGFLAALSASAVTTACAETNIPVAETNMTNQSELGPVFIEVCVNGMTPKALNPNVPRSPQEVTADAFACIEAGATIIHSHTDDPVIGPGTGRHDPLPLKEAWAPVLAENPNILFYPTMQGGGGETTIEDRAYHMQSLIDDGLMRLALIDLGTINVAILDPDGLPVKSDAVFINTVADAYDMFDFCNRNKVGASIGCIEPGAARTAMAFFDKGMVPKGSMFRLMFGGRDALVGLPAVPQALDMMLQIVGRANLPWSVGVAGGNIFDNGFAEYIIRQGGHIRIGLEDYRSSDTPTNLELVNRTIELAEKVGRPIATTEQTLEMLSLSVI